MPWELNIPALHLDLLQRESRQRVRPITKGEPIMDEAAFRAFYEETSRPLFAYLLRVSGERALAEDFLQESYCRFLSAKLSPMDEAGQRSYLFRIATNLLRDRWRRHKEDPLPDPVPEMAAPASHPDLRIDMRQAFRRLKGRERQLLWLAYVEGSSHKEIADLTGLKAGSVRLLLFRARRKLASLIGRSSRDSDPEVDL
ncbi:MAG: sigma-70 family RNA polymerase sigma factor [Candidatus Sulfotelmatobacter sp.]